MPIKPFCEPERVIRGKPQFAAGGPEPLDRKGKKQCRLFDVLQPLDLAGNRVDGKLAAEIYLDRREGAVEGELEDDGGLIRPEPIERQRRIHTRDQDIEQRLRQPQLARLAIEAQRHPMVHIGTPIGRRPRGDYGCLSSANRRRQRRASTIHGIERRHMRWGDQRE